MELNKPFGNTSSLGWPSCCHMPYWKVEEHTFLCTSFVFTFLGVDSSHGYGCMECHFECSGISDAFSKATNDKHSFISMEAFVHLLFGGQPPCCVRRKLGDSVAKVRTFILKSCSKDLQSEAVQTDRSFESNTCDVTPVEMDCSGSYIELENGTEQMAVEKRTAQTELCISNNLLSTLEQRSDLGETPTESSNQILATAIHVQREVHNSKRYSANRGLHHSAERKHSVFSTCTALSSQPNDIVSYKAGDKHDYATRTMHVFAVPSTTMNWQSDDEYIDCRSGVVAAPNNTASYNVYCGENERSTYITRSASTVFAGRNTAVQSHSSETEHNVLSASSVFLASNSSGREEEENITGPPMPALAPQDPDTAGGGIKHVLSHCSTNPLYNLPKPSVVGNLRDEESDSSANAVFTMPKNRTSFSCGDAQTNSALSQVAAVPNNRVNFDERDQQNHYSMSTVLDVSNNTETFNDDDDDDDDDDNGDIDDGRGGDDEHSECAVTPALTRLHRTPSYSFNDELDCFTSPFSAAPNITTSYRTQNERNSYSTIFLSAAREKGARYSSRDEHKDYTTSTVIASPNHAGSPLANQTFQEETATRDTETIFRVVQQPDRSVQCTVIQSKPLAIEKHSRSAIDSSSITTNTTSHNPEAGVKNSSSAGNNRKVQRCEVLLPSDLHCQQQEHYGANCTTTTTASHLCSLCSTSFESCSLLSSHMSCHITAENPFTCPLCERRFRSRSVLREHIDSHIGHQPYECEYCQRTFTRVTSLVVHRRVHSKERPYQCEYCRRSFTQSSDLCRHRRSHSNSRPHQCKECHKRFTRSDILADHLRVHSNYRPYRCEQCGKTFKRSHHLTNHHRVHSRAQLKMVSSH